MVSLAEGGTVLGFPDDERETSFLCRCFTWNPQSCALRLCNSEHTAVKFHSFSVFCTNPSTTLREGLCAN